MEIMKAKSLHFSPSGSVLPIASELGRIFQCVSDKIPPAYPCDNDKIVFIGMELKKGLPGDVDHFCRDLTPARTKNVAFYTVSGDGDTSGLNSIIQVLEAKGVHVAGKPFAVTVKSSLFKKGTPTDADIQAVVKWAKELTEKDLK